MADYFVWVKKRQGSKGVTYRLFWKEPQTGQIKTKTVGSDKAWAMEKASELRRQLREGVYREIKNIDFDDFVAEHLSRVSVGSEAEHRFALQELKAICNPKTLSAIDFSMLEQFRDARAAAAAAPTVNKNLRSLRSILTTAIRRGYLKKNPFTGNGKDLFVREKQKIVTVLTDAEFQKLLGACQDSRWKAFCMCGYYAGLRRGEITRLTWDDVDFDKCIITVKNSKFGKGRQVPMSNTLKDALSALQATRFKSKLVFLNVSGREMRHNLWGNFARIIKRAGLVDDKGKGKFSVHDLRRSFGTNLANRGTSPKILMELMGHSALETTMTYYIHADMDEKLKAVRLLDGIAAG